MLQTCERSHMTQENNWVCVHGCRCQWGHQCSATNVFRISNPSKLGIMLYITDNHREVLSFAETDSIMK